MKSGDGVTACNSLPYISGGSGGATTYAALTDGATVDLPTINAPLANALALLAASGGGNIDGGTPTTIYGGLEDINGGTP
jgi:hypothetical protein